MDLKRLEKEFVIPLNGHIEPPAQVSEESKQPNPYQDDFNFAQATKQSLSHKQKKRLVKRLKRQNTSEIPMLDLTALEKTIDMEEISVPTKVVKSSSSTRYKNKDYKDPVLIQVADGRLHSVRPKTIEGYEEKFDFSVPIAYRREFERLELEFRRQGLHRKYERTLLQTMVKHKKNFDDCLHFMSAYVDEY